MGQVIAGPVDDQYLRVTLRWYDGDRKFGFFNLLPDVDLPGLAKDDGVYVCGRLLGESKIDPAAMVPGRVFLILPALAEKGWYAARILRPDGAEAAQPDPTESPAALAEEAAAVAPDAGGVRKAGHITRLNFDGGFGEVMEVDGSPHFFHYSTVQGGGFDALKIGDHVTFGMDENHKGPCAVDVRFETAEGGTEVAAAPDYGQLPVGNGHLCVYGRVVIVDHGTGEPTVVEPGYGFITARGLSPCYVPTAVLADSGIDPDAVEVAEAANRLFPVVFSAVGGPLGYRSQAVFVAPFGAYSDDDGCPDLSLRGYLYDGGVVTDDGTMWPLAAGVLSEQFDGLGGPMDGRMVHVQITGRTVTAVMAA